MRCDCCNKEEREENLKKPGEFMWKFCISCFDVFIENPKRHTRFKTCKCCGEVFAKERFKITMMSKDATIYVDQFCKVCELKEDKIARGKTILTRPLDKLNAKYLSMKF